MSAVIGPSATNRGGRPLAARTHAIRDAIIDLTGRYERMTVRGIFYALASAGIVEKDDTTGYRPVQRQVLALRRENVLPWSFVADGTRWVRQADMFTGPDDALHQVARMYRRDLWRAQSWRVELWLEKDALADLIWPVADRWGVPLCVSRGCPSATFIYNAAADAQRALNDGVRLTRVLALYDHDAGGARAFRTVEKGFADYCPSAMVELVALNAEQVDAWQLPTRPAKAKDPEAKRWGARAVELDAIPPDVLLKTLDDAISALVDEHAWKVAQAVEAEERLVLENLCGGVS